MSTQRKRPKSETAFGVERAGYDEDIYGPDPTAPPRDTYARHVVEEGPEDADTPRDIPAKDVDLSTLRKTTAQSITAPQEYLDEAAKFAAENATDLLEERRAPTIAERQSQYHARRFDRPLSPFRDETASDQARSAAERNTAADGGLEDKAKSENGGADEAPEAQRPKKRRRRWDLGPEDVGGATELSTTTPTSAVTDLPQSSATSTVSDQASNDHANGAGEKPATRSRWDATPTRVGAQSRWDMTPATQSGAPTSRWDETPLMSGRAADERRSRWDETPNLHTDSIGSQVTASLAAGSAVAPELVHASRWQADVAERNQPLTDDDLDRMLPSEGYQILKQPENYKPIRTPARKLLATPAPLATPLYSVPEEGGIRRQDLGIPAKLPESLKGLEMKPEDYSNFAAILDDNQDDTDLPDEDQRNRKIMRLLLKIKNGSPPVRKVALRQITDKAREFGAGPLFSQILPLLMSPTLEDQERHLYVKVIDRILGRLNDMVRPFVHKILVVIQPLLIDEDYYARAEGREIISNLAKAAGLGTMISTMRPDIDDPDEYVRNVSARAFAVVASALGIPALLKFLQAVCRSKKSWYARHTGIKIVQQIAILMGFGVLPHLRELVQVVGPGLQDEQAKVRTVSALALAALAEACAPFGIESFEPVMKPLWDGMHLHRSRTLAAMLKAIGFILPLMDEENASFCARKVNTILIREFSSSDEEMKRIVLRVVQQCVSCRGVDAEYVRNMILPDFFRCFWIRRMAFDRRNHRLVVDTTLEIAIKVGGSHVLDRLVGGLKDESEPFRRMVVETIGNVAAELGLSDVDTALEQRLIDGMLWAFQEYGNSGADESPVVLNALCTVVEKLNTRAKPYLNQIVSIVQWRLNNKNAKIREYSADLMAKTAGVMMRCKEEVLMGHIGVVLFEYLGEEFPDVLGSILRALKNIVEVIQIENMKPPVKDLLPRLTPILKNRHEKVQENCILLVGQIAAQGAQYIPAREWMRICFELLDLLKASRKAIRKSAVSTFGYIAKAIGANNVLVTLLNNLKVQERTQRVCTTVAIAIVAEKCQPYTVVPALMNEYRIQEMNVQNGVLKSLSFLFEYIGDTSKDYIYALVPVLEDALIDRDLVHRQTACSAVGHLAVGVRGCGVEDALLHLLNHVWPNIFETSPHVVNSVMFAVEGCMVALGPGIILLYLLQGLFHPARKVREVYWRIYNRLYVYGQDALVPVYPRLRVPELDAHGVPKEIDAGLGASSDVFDRSELFVVL